MNYIRLLAELSGGDSGSDSKGTTSARSYASSSGYGGDMDVEQLHHASNSKKRGHLPHVIDLKGRTTGRSPSTGAITVSDEYHLHHRRHPTSNNKRRKQQDHAEANYAASTANQDLARAQTSASGSSILEKIGDNNVCRTQRRAFSLFPPNVKIDMSKVTRVTATEYDQHATTTVTTEDDDEDPVVASSLPAYDTNLLTSLISESRSYYRCTLSVPSSSSTPINAKVATTNSMMAESNMMKTTTTTAPLTKLNLMKWPLAGDGGTSTGRSAGVGAPATLGDEEGARKEGKGSGTRAGTPSISDFESSLTDGSSDDESAPERRPPVGVSAKAAARTLDAVANTTLAADDATGDESKEEVTVSQVPASTNTEMSSTFVRIGDALASSKRPRVIALSFRPFTVVHVNSAFTELMRQHSVQALGRPLYELFLQDPIVAAAVQTSCSDFALTSLDGRAVRIMPTHSSDNKYAPSPLPPSNESNNSCSSDPSLVTTLRARPIGGQDGSSSSNHNITHYLLEIVVVPCHKSSLVREDDENNENDGKEEPPSTNKAPHSFLMGVVG